MTIQVLAHPKINYEEAIGQIRLWRHKENLGSLFGNERMLINDAKVS
jgi:hypothetical protein